MAKFTATTYLTPAALKVAVDLLDNTVIIHVVPFMENGKQKFMLIA